MRQGRRGRSIRTTRGRGRRTPDVLSPVRGVCALRGPRRYGGGPGARPRAFGALHAADRRATRRPLSGLPPRSAGLRRQHCTAWRARCRRPRRRSGGVDRGGRVEAPGPARQLLWLPDHRRPRRATRSSDRSCDPAGATAPPEERTWFRQALRWRQNQPFNPPSLGPVTWGDYRKCGWRRLFQTFHYSLRDPVETKLASVACPTLVVRGELDPICRRPWAEEVTRRLPRGQLAEISGVAHTLVYTSPVELAAAIRPFLDTTREFHLAAADMEPRHARGLS